MSAGIVILRHLLSGVTVVSARMAARGSGFHSGRMRDPSGIYLHTVGGGTVQDQRHQNQKLQRVGQNLHRARRYWI